MLILDCKFTPLIIAIVNPKTATDIPRTKTKTHCLLRIKRGSSSDIVSPVFLIYLINRVSTIKNKSTKPSVKIDFSHGKVYPVYNVKSFKQGQNK
jgi:hypothetical protein